MTIPARERPLLDALSFTVRAGELVALMGLNRSGKTTLLSTIAGLYNHQGEVVVQGTRLTPKTAARTRKSMGYLFNVPEDQLLFPRVIDDVAYGLVRQGMPRDQAHAGAHEMLTRLGIADRAHCSVHDLSHGQKQRVALAGALVTGASLLLLDEPSAALDPVAKMQLLALLRSLEARTLLCATNDLPFAKALCDRFVLLEEGRLILDSADVTGVMAHWGISE